MDTKSIIYVEDEFNIANMVYSVLTSQGYDVILSSWGAEAARLVQAHPYKYSLLITDLYLHNIKGNEVAELIKKSCPNINVIITTGDMSVNEQKLKRSGVVNEVIFKPFSVKDFFEKVNRLL